MSERSREDGTGTVQVGRESWSSKWRDGQSRGTGEVGVDFWGCKLFGKWETFSSGAQRVSRLEAKREI